MKRMTCCPLLVPALFLVLACMIVPSANAALLGTVPTAPGGTVFPGLVPPGTDPGTLLASETAPFTSTLGFNSGTLVSAVFREGGGTLDFYYQLTNNATAPNCGTSGKPACDPLSRETNTDFFGFVTSTGFRLDGSSLPGGIFVDGTVPPVTADRNSAADVVGFQFNPPDPAKIQPGQVSEVLVISTNATNFTAGNASVIDGGVATVSAFEPAAVPEPASLLLLSGGLLALVGIHRFRV
jgi:hypothetical protein